MQEVFEKILGKLNNKKTYFQGFYDTEGKTKDDEDINKATQLAFDDAIEIVKQVAEEYKECALCYSGTPCEYQNKDCRIQNCEINNGWIPCSERLPEEYGDYLIIWTDIRGTRFYEICEYEPNEGWIGDIPQAFNGKYSVIAWQPLPEPYKGV